MNNLLDKPIELIKFLNLEKKIFIFFILLCFLASYFLYLNDYSSNNPQNINKKLIVEFKIENFHLDRQTNLINSILYNLNSIKIYYLNNIELYGVFKEIEDMFKGMEDKDQLYNEFISSRMRIPDKEFYIYSIDKHFYQNSFIEIYKKYYEQNFDQNSLEDYNKIRDLIKNIKLTQTQGDEFSYPMRLYFEYPKNIIFMSDNEMIKFFDDYSNEVLLAVNQSVVNYVNNIRDFIMMEIDNFNEVKRLNNEINLNNILIEPEKLINQKYINTISDNMNYFNISKNTKTDVLNFKVKIEDQETKFPSMIFYLFLGFVLSIILSLIFIIVKYARKELINK